jgi:hypothetical protein
MTINALTIGGMAVVTMAAMVLIEFVAWLGTLNDR